MKKIIAAIIITLCLVWGCATLNPQNVRLVIDSIYVTHTLSMEVGNYLYSEGRLSRKDMRDLNELDYKYHALDQIVRDAVAAWEIALTISEKEGDKKKAALDKFMIEFTKIAFELNDLIQDLKNRDPKDVKEEEEL